MWNKNIATIAFAYFCLFQYETESFFHHRFRKYSFETHNIKMRSSSTHLNYQTDNKAANVITSETDSYLKSIINYGDNRMARKAVNILETMIDDDIDPTERHYTATIQACGRSDQYKLGTSITMLIKAYM